MADPIQTYCLKPSQELTHERDELLDELMSWLTDKALAGARPVPLQYALRAAAAFAAGYGEGEAFWEKVRTARRFDEPRGP